MSKPASTSPFAALTSQEQKEMWICWQIRHANDKTSTIDALPEKQTIVEHRSGSVFVSNEPTEVGGRFRPHHGQYDAVVRRMQQACRRAGTYSSCQDS